MPRETRDTFDINDLENRIQHLSVAIPLQISAIERENNLERQAKLNHVLNEYNSELEDCRRRLKELKKPTYLHFIRRIFRLT